MKITLLPSEKGDCLLIEVRRRRDPGRWRHARLLRGRGARLPRHASPRPAASSTSSMSRMSTRIISPACCSCSRTRSSGASTSTRYANGQPATKPKFNEPPAVKRIWHNAFKALVRRMPARSAPCWPSRANSLSSSGNPAALRLAAAYSNIANSIPEAIKVSRRIAADQLNIPLERRVRQPARHGPRHTTRSSSSPDSKLSIRVIGPFEKDLEILRDYWNAWLAGREERQQRSRSLKDWLENNRAGLPAGTLGLSIDDEIGHRTNVTEPNLASLMLLLEEQSPAAASRARS